MKIVVLLKQVPDTWGERRLDPETGRIVREKRSAVPDEIDERALEVALRHKDLDKATEVVLVSMGPASAAESLRKGLSMGADSAVHLLDDGLVGADLLRTAEALAAAVRGIGFDLLIAGGESTDGRGGVIPAMLAEHLGVAELSFLDSVEIEDGVVRGERNSDGTTVRAHAATPVVVSVGERVADARFPSFKGIVGARKKPMEEVAMSALGIPSPSGSNVVLSVSERPARAAGTKIVDTGSAGIELADYLRSNHLV